MSKLQKFSETEAQYQNCIKDLTKTIEDLNAKLNYESNEKSFLRKKSISLMNLVLESFQDGYNKAEDGQTRGDNAWEYSTTHDELRKITGAEWHEMEW
jgi:tRNA U34 5-carboxymethylaminomethyl modifying GTPase MnmE/TrmE